MNFLTCRINNQIRKIWSITMGSSFIPCVTPIGIMTLDIFIPEVTTLIWFGKVGQNIINDDGSFTN